MASTSTQAAPTISTFPRYRGSVNGTQCRCANGHITEAAAIKCVRSQATKEHEATAVPFDRFQVNLSATETCEHAYGHKSKDDAMKCAKRHGPKAAATPKVKAEPEPKTTATASASAKPTPKPRALRSVSAGSGKRA
jgi:hypothetical protein